VERLSDVRWSISDLPLVDEAQELLDRNARRYGHVILDEAQDLTPMQLRMVGRRVSGGSVTVLGDLAQATGLWSYSTWKEVAQHLGLEETAELEELTHAYRVPREIMEVALPVLELTAPSITAPIPFRAGGHKPSFVAVERDRRLLVAIHRARDAHGEGGTAAIISPPSLLPSLREDLGNSGIDFGDAERGELATTVELLDPTMSKGLEFDHVVVLEPAAIIREAEGQGQRDLYVALTRATRTLTCIHSEPLPWPLGDQHAIPPAARLKGVSTSILEAEPLGTRGDAPSAPISVGEALVLARMRGMDVAEALARALLAQDGGGQEGDVARAILDASSIDPKAVAALLASLPGRGGEPD
jgi:hypothetical protein